VPEQDFHETFSSVAKFTTLHALLSITSYRNMELHQIDIVSAYLQGNLEEEIYMEVLEGWLWKLLKALYSLKQGGQQWKMKLNEVMNALRFKLVRQTVAYISCGNPAMSSYSYWFYVDDIAVTLKLLLWIKKIQIRHCKEV
jgi:hypothetical protein